MLSEVVVAGAPTPGGPYSAALAVGDLIFVSGQRPVRAATDQIPATFEEQATLVLENLRRVLEASGSGLGLVAKVSVYLADLANFEAFNRIYQQFFSPPYPARTTVGCALRGIQVEVDSVAVRRTDAR
jgi:2-iminobutanoate/2-iminopropanoate deaminase